MTYTPEDRALQNAKQRAYYIFARALRKGELERQPCEVCDVTPSEGHHDDYTKPLDVRWLCRPHHNDVHYGSRPRQYGAPMRARRDAERARQLIAIAQEQAA